MKKNTSIKRSIAVIIIAVLFIVPVFFITYSHTHRNKISIGVISTEIVDIKDLNATVKALNEFEGIFNARIINYNFNESMVRIKNGLYLTDDYLANPQLDDIQIKYKIDIVLVFTNRTINNWLDTGDAIWGEASTIHSTSIITTWPHPGSTHGQYLNHTVIHEVLHVIGYSHPPDARKCVMRYATIDYELCDECKSELSYHVLFWRVGRGQDNGRAIFLINLSTNIFFFMFLSAIIVTLMVIPRSSQKIKSNTSLNSMIYSIGLLAVFTLLSSSFLLVFYPRLVLMATSVPAYVIIETLGYLKNKGKVDNDLRPDNN